MCEHIEKLKAQGYVDGSLIYLQRVVVNTDFPEICRIAHYCLYCGIAIKEHVPSFNNYRFNLVTIDEYSKFRSSDSNYPVPTTVRFCPYCGEQQNR